MAVASGTPTELEADRSAEATPVWWVARMVLLALVLALMAMTAAVGHSPGELDVLTGALSSHRLGEVTVVGDGLPSDATGCRTQQVVWRDHGLLRSVDLVVQKGDVSGCGMGMTETLDPPVTDVAVWVHQLDAGVTVLREPSPSAMGTVGRWTVPARLAGMALLTGLMELFVLVAGPEPWRATRWAWFWLTGSVVGAIALLILSGPTPGLPGPRRPQRRLTGGWAFLLGLVLAAAAPTWLVLSA